MNSQFAKIDFLKKVLLLSLGFVLLNQSLFATQVTASLRNQSPRTQQRLISVHFNKKPLADVLHELARKANAGISYKTEIVPSKVVSYQAKNRSIFKILADVLDDTGLYAALSENRKVILIKKKVQKEVLQSTITGTVTDAANHKTLPAANIKVKGTSNGTSTNANGQYKLTVESLQDTLEFSFVGYQSKEVPIKGRTTINVTLTPSTVGLEELVVSGLASSVKRENAAHAIAKIDADELTGGTTPSTTAGALEGKVVGANISSTGGAPGGGIDFKLRGVSTLGSGSSQPLIIVDGVYLNNVQLQSGLSAVSAQADPNQDDTSNRLADLNPDDIESIQVLKGPSAAAIYGARANAGVVIIKTKRGSEGNTEVSFSQDIGYSRILHKLDRPSWDESKIDLVYGEGTALAETAKQMYEEAVANDNMHDYQDLLFGNKGASVNTEIRISGGDTQTQFLVAGEFKRNDGIIKNTGFDRASYRANLDHDFGKNITIHSSSNYINSQTKRGWTGNGGVGSVVQAVAYTPPFAQLLPDDKGNYPTNPFFQMNPLELINYGKNNQDINRFLQSVATDIGLYNDGGYSLQLKIDGGLDFLNANSMAYMPAFLQYQQNQPNPGDVIHSSEKDLNINLNSFLVYNMTLGSEQAPWNLTTQVGYTTFHEEQQRLQVRGRGLVAGQTNTRNATIQEIYNQFSEDVTDVGYVGQQKANWDDKIIGTLGIRLDKSTLNMNQGKYYFFPKASVAMNLTNFDFWKAGAVNQFKLRAAYGETGGLPNFGVTFNALNSGNISGNLGTYRSIRTIDPNLKPETAAELEFGADIGLFNNRVSLEATYYEKDVNDLILDRQLPGSSGLQTEATNAADLRNRGIELSFNLVPVRNKRFTWNAAINWSKNNAKITKLKVPPFTTGGFGAALGTFYIAKGFSPTTIVGTPYDDEAGHYTVYGNNQPDFQLSFSNAFNFLKNWKFNFLWQLKYGQKDINLFRLLSDAGGTTEDWNKDYNNNGIPNGKDREKTGAARYIEDATYLKLREISLYYTVPNIFLDKFTQNTVKSIRLGVSGNNVLLFSPFSGYDPETSEFGASAIGTGVAVAPYPSSRRIMFHLNFDF